MTMKTITQGLLTLLISLLLVSGAQADRKGDSEKITFTGTLMHMAGACIVNNGGDISVQFGNVAVSQVKYEKFIQPLNYTLQCPGAVPGSRISMTFKATPVSGGDGATLASSVPGLWVRVLREKQPQPLNKAFDVPNVNTPPALSVELRQDPTVVLRAGAFSAIGTLVAEYQ